MPNEDVTHFTAVDQTRDPAFFARFLDEGNKLPAIVASKPIIIDGLCLRGEERVLDVGCGMGADVFDLAARVGTAGHVTGVDLSASLIEEARWRAAGRNLPVTFEVGDAQALQFEDGAFDAVRTERMLMHVPDADRAFAEMARVLRPGGHLAFRGRFFSECSTGRHSRESGNPGKRRASLEKTLGCPPARA